MSLFVLAAAWAASALATAAPLCDAALADEVTRRLESPGERWTSRCREPTLLELERTASDGSVRSRLVQLEGVSENLRIEVAVLAGQALRAPARESEGTRERSEAARPSPARASKVEPAVRRARPPAPHVIGYVPVRSQEPRADSEARPTPWIPRAEPVPAPLPTTERSAQAGSQATAGSPASVEATAAAPESDVGGRWRPTGLFSSQERAPSNRLVPHAALLMRWFPLQSLSVGGAGAAVEWRWLRAGVSVTAHPFDLSTLAASKYLTTQASLSAALACAEWRGASGCARLDVGGGASFIVASPGASPPEGAFDAALSLEGSLPAGPLRVGAALQLGGSASPMSPLSLAALTDGGWTGLWGGLSLAVQWAGSGG